MLAPPASRSRSTLRAGAISFRLIEKMDDPFRGSRGKGIQPRTQEIFEDLGIIDRIVAVGGLYPPQREYRDDGSYAESDVVEHQDPTPAEPYDIASDGAAISDRTRDA